MVEVPAATPLTTPVPGTTVATVVILLLQVPPPASLNVVVEPAHTDAIPVIDEGKALTVTVVTAKHPVPSV